MDFSKKCNDLSSKEWLQNSFSIWRGLTKTKEEREYNHPASYPMSLCIKILRTFAKPHCRVIDPFNGIGSTTTAASQLSCQAVGIDLSIEYCRVAKNRVNNDHNIKIINGNSLEIVKTLQSDYFDLCLTSPPYWDILNMKRTADKKTNQNYSEHDQDLGNIPDYYIFLSSLSAIFLELKRTLRKNAYCIVNVMDIRKRNNFYPLHIDIVNAMREIGYIFDDLIIWDRQSDYNNMRHLGYPYKFRINKVHEYLLIFIKD